MNTSVIREKANDYFNRYAHQLARIFLIIGLLSLIPSLADISSPSEADVWTAIQNGSANRVFSYGGLIFVLLSILFIPLEQGYIVSALKVVTNRGYELNDADAFTGIRDYLDLISTYLFRILYIIGFTLVPCIGMSFIAMLFIAMRLQPLAIMMMMVIAVMLIALLIRNYLATILVGFLIEDRHIHNTEAVGESVRMMEGHKMEMIRLVLGYFLIILAMIIASAFVSAMLQVPLTALFGSMAGHIIANILGNVLWVALASYTFRPKIYLAYAIFYEELSYLTVRR